jgi:hypothetical protein
MALIDATVELFIDDTWTDITDYVRADPGVNITFGVQQENNTADPATCTFSVNNRDGRFTPRNAAGAYYPYLTRNTPVRVLTGAASRFAGEISEFPVRWDPSEADVYVPLVGSGVLRRLARSNVLDSTLKFAVTTASTIADITGYWPLEDAPGSAVLASALPGTVYGFITTAPDFAAVDPGVMSKPIPTWDGARADFIPAAGSGTGFIAGILVTFPAAGTLTGGEELLRVNVNGTLQSWRLLYSPGSGGGVLVQIVNSSNVEVHAAVEVTAVDEKTTFLKIEATQNGGNVDWSLTAIGVGFGGVETEAGTVGAPTAAAIGAGTVDPGNVAIGHLILADTDDALFLATFDDGLAGYDGEKVGDRMTRLAAQGGVPITVIDHASYEPTEMGVQPDGSFLDVLRAAEKADVGGILRDAINTPGMLVYSTRTSRYNDNRPVLTLDYAAGHLTFAEPTDDDQNLRNDITANRLSGSSARVELTSGPLSTADYPDGVGPYRFEDTYATYQDSQLPYVASWLLRLGTVDETRWPRIGIDLVRNSDLVTDWDLIRPGDRVRVENLPAISGVSDVDLHCIGWTEHITGHRRRVTLNCVPGTPWQVFELNDAVFGELDVMHLAL